MKDRKNMLWMALALVSLGGCATMSGEECLTSDWAAIGYEDGAQGLAMERMTQRRKACAKHGVTPNFAAYQDGRDKGLVEYCQPGRAFNVGSNGGRYKGVCRADLEVDFLEAYNAGYHLFTLRNNVSRASSDIAAKEGELDRIKDHTLAKEAALINSNTNTEQRVILLSELKDLSERTGELEAQIRELYEQRARLQVELEQYQVSMLDYGY